jgi:hypothetical protein
LTYYGYRVIFTWTFACGCTRRRGPIYEKIAYQYVGLGKRQWCREHTAIEVKRSVRKVD